MYVFKTEKRQAHADAADLIQKQVMRLEKNKKGGDFLNKAQGLFQKGKGFLDNNPGIKSSLGNVLGGNKPSNDSAPTQTYSVQDSAPAPKKKMSMGVKIGIAVAAAALVGTLLYFGLKKKK